MADSIKTIRYMGNKSKLLDFIIPEIEKITRPGDCILDLMAGTCAVSYALKGRNKIITNDVQYYSKVISDAIIVNKSTTINSDTANADLNKFFIENMANSEFNFFEKVYSDTYFSKEQCKEIDSIRFAIDKINDENKKSLYLLALMGAMSSCESTPGHFAQYLNKNHYRLVKIRQMSVYATFLEKCNDYNDIVSTEYNNYSNNIKAEELLDDVDKLRDVKCIYIDTPYTAEQYSRFYHVLETVTKYDNPHIENNKGLYRDDRFMSDFSSRSSVYKAFDCLIKKCYNVGANIVVSYSDRGLVGVEELAGIIKKYYGNCDVKRMKYSHSTQGKGSITLNEVLFIAVV